MLTGLVQNHHPTREHANTVDTLKAVKRGTTHLRNASEFTNDPADAGADAISKRVECRFCNQDDFKN